MNRIFSLFRISFSLLFALALLSGNTYAQRYLSERLGIHNEARAVADFGDSLAVFAKKSDVLLKKESLTRLEVASLEADGKKITDGTSNFQSNLQQLITKLKNSGNWNEQFDTDFLAAVKSANARAAINQAGGARKLLEAVLSDVVSPRDVVNTNINEAKAKLVAGNRRAAGEEVFTAHAFRKSFKCIALGVGLAIAEVAGADRTACRLDEAYGEAGCGGKKPCAAT